MLTENDYHFISPGEALNRFPMLKEWLSPEHTEEEPEEGFPAANEILFSEWGGRNIVLYDGDTTFSENLSVQFAIKKQGEDGSGYSRKIIVNGNLSAPETDTSYFSMLVVTGNLNCNIISTGKCAVIVCGNLIVKNSLQCLAEDHDDIKTPFLKVIGQASVPYIFTWYSCLPSIKFLNPEKTLALRSGFEDDNAACIPMLVHRELPLYLKAELCNKREEEWHDNIIFTYKDGNWLINEYIDKGKSVFKDGITTYGIHLCMQAVKAYKEGAYNSARPLLEKAITESPAYGYSYYWLADLYLQEDNYGQALLSLRKSLDADPHFIWAQTDMAYCLNKSGQYKEAADYATRAIITGFNLDYTNGKAFRHRGEAQIYLGNLPEALSDLNRAIDADSSIVMAWYYRGMAHYKMGNQEKAINDYKQYRDMDPSPVLPYYDTI